MNFFNNNFTSHSGTSTIFQLRKQGKISEAFEELKRQLPNNYPQEKVSITDQNTKWLAIAIKCVVSDLIKIETNKNTKDTVFLAYLVQLLDGIDTGDDESAESSIESLKRKANPDYILIEQEKEIPHEGSQKKAISLLKKYINSTHDIYYTLSLGWRIYFQIIFLLSGKPIICFKVKNYLKEYFNLKLNPKIDENNLKLHRCILIAAKKFYTETQKQETKIVGDRNFIFSNFLYKWDLSNLTNEDWKKDPNNNYKPLAVSVIEKGAQNFSKQEKPDPRVLYNLFPYIEKAINQDKDDNVWLHLHFSRILQKMNKTDESVCHLLSVIEEKTDAWWAWKELGEIYISQGNIELAESCFCKALLISKNNESYKINVHKELAEILYNKHDIPRSKAEYLKYFSSASKISHELESLKSSEWYLTATACTDMQDYYEIQANKANDVLYENLPWIDAILGPEIRFKVENKTKRKRIIYVSPIRQNLLDTAEKIDVPCNGYDFSSLNVGSSLQVKGEYKGNLFHMYLCKKADNNNSAIVKTVFAYIYNVDKNNELFFAVIKEKCTVKDSIKKLRQIPPRIGSVIKISVCSEYNKKTNQDNIKIIDILDKGELTDLSSDAIVDRCGEIRIITDDCDKNKIKFGFVDGIFVPENIIDINKFHNGDFVKIKAISSFNNKKKIWSYKAISLENYDVDKLEKNDPDDVT